MSIRILDLNTDRETFAIEYKEDIGQVQKMPVILRVNGLASAMTYCKRKDKPLHDYCAKWLKEYQSKYKVFPPGSFERDTDFVQDLMGLDSRQYFLAMKELDALFGALKRNLLSNPI